MENKMKYNKIIQIFINPCKQKNILRSHNHWHQDELKNAGNTTNIKQDSPRMTNLENI